MSETIELYRFRDKYAKHRLRYRCIRQLLHDAMTSSAAHTFGFLYVLSNPAMPGHLKIGRTRRRPQDRMAELSQATGVPVPFELAYSHAFENVNLAESLVHQELEARGARVASNREFFEIAVAEAKAVIVAVYERLHDPQMQEAMLEELDTRAQQLLAQDTAAAREQALSCLEYAGQLGGAEQTYQAAELALGLARQRSEQSATGQSYRKKALILLEHAAQQGVVRAHAQRALLSLEAAEPEKALQELQRYLDALPQPDMPEGELEFLLEALAQRWPRQESRALPGIRLRPWRSQLIRSARKRNDLEFQRWIAHQSGTPLENAVERFKLPLLAIGGFALLAASRPDWAFLLALGAGVWLLRRRSSQRARKGEKAPRRGFVGGLFRTLLVGRQERR